MVEEVETGGLIQEHNLVSCHQPHKHVDQEDSFSCRTDASVSCRGEATLSWRRTDTGLTDDQRASTVRVGRHADRQQTVEHLVIRLSDENLLSQCAITKRRMPAER